jgi:predicted RNase H-like HicB family nuclease
MQELGFTVIYTPIEDGWYMALVLELPEAISQGETLEEAREMIRDAVRELLELRREEAERELGASGSPGAIREPLVP